MAPVSPQNWSRVRKVLIVWAPVGTLLGGPDVFFEARVQMWGWFRPRAGSPKRQTLGSTARGALASDAEYCCAAAAFEAWPKQITYQSLVRSSRSKVSRLFTHCKVPVWQSREGDTPSTCTLGDSAGAVIYKPSSDPVPWWLSFPFKSQFEGSHLQLSGGFFESK